MDYPYVGSERLIRRKPYSFSAFGGSTFLGAHAARRALFAEELRSTGAPHDAELAMSTPVDPTGTGERCRVLDVELASAWQEELDAAGAIGAACWLERVVTVHRREGLPLAGDDRWSVRVVRHWVERFEAFGCLHTRYDRRGRRVERDPNRPEVVVRLAAAAGCAGRDAADVATATIHLNALLKANDLVDAQWHHAESEREAAIADFALLALDLEAALLDRVARHAAVVRAPTGEGWA